MCVAPAALEVLCIVVQQGQYPPISGGPWKSSSKLAMGIAFETAPQCFWLLVPRHTSLMGERYCCLLFFSDSACPWDPWDECLCLEWYPSAAWPIALSARHGHVATFSHVKESDCDGQRLGTVHCCVWRWMSTQLHVLLVLSLPNTGLHLPNLLHSLRSVWIASMTRPL